MIASPIATIELHFTSRARQGESLEALGGLITGGKLASEGRIGVRNGHSNGYYSRSWWVNRGGLENKGFRMLCPFCSEFKKWGCSRLSELRAGKILTPCSAG